MSDEQDQGPVGPTHHQRTFSPEAPRITDELYEAFPNVPTPYSINPEDGLPQAQMPSSVRLALAPEQTIDKLICRADTREFVIRDSWGEIAARFTPDEVEQAPNGRYRVPLQLVKDKQVREYEQYQGWVEVVPIRPACQHYARQLVDFPEDPDHQYVARLCTARRTDEGEFLSLHATAVYGCELRYPPDADAQRAVDEFEARLDKQIQNKPEPFDLDAALGEAEAEAQLQTEAKADPAGGGIFRTTL